MPCKTWQLTPYAYHRPRMSASGVRAPSHGYLAALLTLLVFFSIITVLYFQITNEASEATQRQRQRLRRGQLDKMEIFSNYVDANVCGDLTITTQHERDPFVVFLVHSARHHVQYRRAIRETWGSVSELGDWTFRLVFLIGLDKHGALGDYLDAEALTHGDTVVGSFHDTYRNLTLKHLLGYKWVVEHCKRATFVVKVDDDIFVNLSNLVDLLNQHRSAYHRKIANNILCNEGNRVPERGLGSTQKWLVTQDEYSEAIYPEFCLGGAYITTPSNIKHLFSVRGHVPFFWIDDIFVTGLLRAFHSNNVATKKSELIGVKDISKYIEFQNAQWQSHKIFYLLKTDSGMNFESMKRLWAKSNQLQA